MGMTSEELDALLEENENLRETNAALRDEIASLQTELAGIGHDTSRYPDLCWPCEVKRRWLAAILGLNLAGAWLFASFRWLRLPEWLLQHRPHIHPAALCAAVGLALAGGPLIGVIASWRWTLFKRSQVWKRWRIVRAWQVFREPVK